MNWSQSFIMAFKAIAGNKMRSFLTMLGIVIGVFAVVVLVAIGEGASASVTSSLQGLGTNLISVTLHSGRNITIDQADLDALLAEHDSIAAIDAYLSTTAAVKAGSTSTTASVQGVGASYAQIRDIAVARGRFITRSDTDNRSGVAVVGVDLANDLYGTENVLGNTLKINGRSYRIVGVLQSEGTSITGSNDNTVMIPFTLAQRAFGQSDIRSFFLSASSAQSVTQAQRAAEVMLLRKYGGDDEAYSIYNQSELLDALSEATGVLTLMLGGIAGISLLVGGIGIMNIMLVSVTERTREIGIRKAIGARRIDILVQFAIEAVVISVVGGALGLVLGGLAMQLLSDLWGIPVQLSAGVVQMALGFSIAVGVVFGLYPANKASRLRPIDALRYE